MPGKLPDLLDVAGLSLGPMIDPERVLVLWRPDSRYRIAEPVRRPKVRPVLAKDLPAPREDFVSSLDKTVSNLLGH